MEKLADLSLFQSLEHKNHLSLSVLNSLRAAEWDLDEERAFWSDYKKREPLAPDYEMLLDPIDEDGGWSKCDEIGTWGGYRVDKYTHTSDKPKYHRNGAFGPITHPDECIYVVVAIPEYNNGIEQRLAYSHSQRKACEIARSRNDEDFANEYYEGTC